MVSPTPLPPPSSLSFLIPHLDSSPSSSTFPHFSPKMLLGSDLAAVLSSASSRDTTPTPFLLASASPSSLRRPSPLSRQRSPLAVPRAPLGILRPSDQCQHFHYELVELGPVRVEWSRLCPRTHQLTLTVKSNGQIWKLWRTPSEMVEFDRQLHRCVFDRRHSRLEELSPIECQSEQTLRDYLDRLSLLTGSLMRCYSVLTFLELDNRGNHFLPVDHSPINTPAVACAVAVRPFCALRPGQLSLQVGDIVSVVEMRMRTEQEGGGNGEEEEEGEGEEDEGMWMMRGKLTVPCDGGREEEAATTSAEGINSNNRQFGSFPADCVRLFSDRLSLGEQLWLASNASCPIPRPSCSSSPSSPLLFLFRHRFSSSILLPHHRRRSHPPNGSFRSRHSSALRSFFLRFTHPSNAIFGVDLVKLANRQGRQVPEMVEQCLAIVERGGMEPGIYRQCGVQSNVRRLRQIFNSGRIPHWDSPSMVPVLRNDIHSVGSLLKQFFRQLPNPLLPFECYTKLIDTFANGCSSEKELVVGMRELVREFPPAHFHTARRLFLHLHAVSQHPRTRSTAQNLAILWTPNLIRHFLVLPHKSLLIRFRCPPANSIADIRHQMIGLNLHTDICAFLITLAEKIFVEEKDDTMEAMADTLKSPAENEKFKKIETGENGKIPEGGVHSVIERPIGRDRGKRTVMVPEASVPLSMAHTVNGTLGWQQVMGSKRAENENMEPGVRRRGSADDRNIRPPLERSKLFSSLGRGLEGVGQTIFRRVRSIRASVQKYRRQSVGRRETAGRERAGTGTREVQNAGAAEEQRAEGAGTAANSAGLLLALPFADDANSTSKTSPSSRCSSANSSDPSTVKGPSVSNGGRRVNFRPEEEAEEGIGDEWMVAGEQEEEAEGAEEEAEGAEEEAEGAEEEAEGPRREDSVDSVPLDISRYDNVSSIVIAVPQSPPPPKAIGGGEGKGE